MTRARRALPGNLWRVGGKAAPAKAALLAKAYASSREHGPSAQTTPALAGDWAFETLSSVGVSMRRLAKARWQGLDEKKRRPKAAFS